MFDITEIIGTNTYVAYFDANGFVTGESGLSWDPTDKTLQVKLAANSKRGFQLINAADSVVYELEVDENGNPVIIFSDNTGSNVLEIVCDGEEQIIEATTGDLVLLALADIYSDLYIESADRMWIDSVDHMLIEASAGEIRMDGDEGFDIESGNDINVTGDELIMTGKITADDFDPKTIQYMHTPRQEVIDKYKNWALEGEPQTVEFFNSETGKKEYYFPLTGEFKDPVTYAILHTITPQFNTEFELKHHWDRRLGQVVIRKKPIYEKTKLEKGKKVNRATGVVEDRPFVERWLWDDEEGNPKKYKKYIHPKPARNYVPIPIPIGKKVNRETGELIDRPVRKKKEESDGE